MWLLQVDEEKSSKIMDILHFPAVKAEVNKLLSSTEFDEKFIILMTRKLNFT